MNLADLRENYTKGGIRIAEMHPSPFAQLEEWFQVARDQKIPDSNAMNLATSNKEGLITSRTVLLKGVVEKKLQFFTNYQSQKARDLAENPHAAMTFHWRELERQICIRGTVEKTSREVSEAYFKSRPYDSQIGAWVSEKQSSRIGVRSKLEDRQAEFEARFPNQEDLPCPEFWGGYELKPTYIEFWQGRQGRLHDRLCYFIKDDAWSLDRLSP
jgi:pyridoxamine 5'-phosphate oxidase